MPYKTRKQAEVEAKKVQKMLNKDWKINIHENLGWHFMLVNNNLSVHEAYNGGKPYLILMNDRVGGSYSGVGAFCFTPQFDNNPKKAIAKAVKEMDQYYKQIKEAYNKTNEIYDKLKE